MAATLKETILEELVELEKQDITTLLDNRYKRLRSYGAFEA